MADEIRGDIYSGNAFDITRTVPGIPPGDPIVRARLLIKRRKWDTDAAAKVTKDIDLTNQSQVGQVTQTGTPLNGNGTGIVLFHILQAQSALILPDILHWYDVRIWLESGNGHTLRTSTIMLKRRLGIALT